MTSLEEKRIFLIVSSVLERMDLFTTIINKHLPLSTIFTAADGSEGMFKLQNMPPHVLIVDSELPKISGLHVVEQVLHEKVRDDISIIIISELPDKEHFVNDVVIGRIQFVPDNKDEIQLMNAINKALNWSSRSQKTDYAVKFLSPKEILFKEGDQGGPVYLVKHGKLRAFKGPSDAPTVLGEINEGEFVGEMAHISNDVRSASVEATTEVVLIEIPKGTLDAMLFSKPAWSKALMQTLSRRLKDANLKIKM